MSARGGREAWRKSLRITSLQSSVLVLPVRDRYALSGPRLRHFSRTALLVSQVSACDGSMQSSDEWFVLVNVYRFNYEYVLPS